MLSACALLMGLVLMGIGEGIAVTYAGHGLTRLFWAMGATEPPAAYIAYIAAFCVVMLVQIAAWGFYEKWDVADQERRRRG